jgi:AraC-like DNA-binding protein
MLTPPDWTWSDVDVAVPSAQPPGVSMAGFRQRVATPVAIAMVAHPAVTLILDLSGAGAISYDADGRRRHGSFVAGLLPGRVRTGGSLGACLQIRLSPVVASAVLGASTELTGSVAALGDVWNVVPLEERLRAATSWDERFTIAANVLGSRLDTRPAVDPEVAHTWRRTVASRGRVRVESLAGEVGWSRKRLWSRFRAQLGISPKRAARLARFDAAAHLLAAGHTAASVAATSGYVDQSHLHREIRDIAGGTPADIAAAPWLAIDDVAWPTGPRA